MFETLSANLSNISILKNSFQKRVIRGWFQYTFRRLQCSRFTNHAPEWVHDAHTGLKSASIRARNVIFTPSTDLMASGCALIQMPHISLMVMATGMVVFMFLNTVQIEAESGNMSSPPEGLTIGVTVMLRVGLVPKVNYIYKTISTCTIAAGMYHVTQLHH
jgi:hypothetical protein